MEEMLDNKKKLKKQKKKDWIKGILLVIVVFIIAGAALFLYGKIFKNGDADIEEANIKDKIELYDYVLYDNVTEYYTQEFNKLKEMSKDDDLSDEDLAKQVAKLYLIDLFSINYKSNRYEVTSSQYFYYKKKDMHTQKVIDTLYNLVEDNYNGDRKQELPEVSNVEVISAKKDYYLKGEAEKKCWIIELKIEYVKDLGYDNHSQVTLIKDGENMAVVNYKKL